MVNDISGPRGTSRSCRHHLAVRSGPCGRRFVRSMHLKRHRTIHSAGKSGSGRSRIRILKCRFCDKIFKDAGNRNQHVHLTSPNGTLREVEEMPAASLDTYLSNVFVSTMNTTTTAYINLVLQSLKFTLQTTKLTDSQKPFLSKTSSSSTLTQVVYESFCCSGCKSHVGRKSASQ